MDASTLHNGGAAFPHKPARTERLGEYEVHHDGDAPGMSLRDYFAAKAMHAEILTTAGDTTPEAGDALVSAAARHGRTVEQQIAFNAYAMADAMLAARELKR
jgi:hypothetical protein